MARSYAMGLACASLIAVGLTACSHRAPFDDATVTGVVRGYGGPAIVIHGKPREAVDGAAQPNVLITATRTDGLVVKADTDPHGRYGIGLPAGTYSIRSACGTPVTITVRSFEHLRVPLRCDFP